MYIICWIEDNHKIWESVSNKYLMQNFVEKLDEIGITLLDIAVFHTSTEIDNYDFESLP